jgi:glucose-6-phosphate 1-dehydrogenase
LLPALFNLYLDGFLPETFAIVGVARREKSDAAFRDDLLSDLRDHSRRKDLQAEAWERFAANIFYQQLSFTEDAHYDALRGRLEEIEKERGMAPKRLYYQAISPEFFCGVIERLGRHGLIQPVHETNCWSRVVIEKPFGTDLASSRELNASVVEVLDEEQIYRIDHYLGKETVQNILSFRFGNSIFEPLFNNKYVDHVQITVAESIGMEGRRGEYYDHAGAIRDVMQNHALQLLCLVAMEPPAVFGPKEIRDEKVKVLRSLSKLTAETARRDVVRGQYTAGEGPEGALPGYLDEEGVAAGSSTETYVALRCGIDNWRWAGVPFLVRTGKCLPKRVTEIAVQFKPPPLHFFKTVECVGEVCNISRARPNVVVFRIQPNESISISFSAKRPGMHYDLHPVEMDFVYGESFAHALPEAYERLLLDALRGDSTLFTRSDEVESAWAYLQPIFDAWESDDPPEVCRYPAGTWGPVEADALFEQMDADWRRP